MDKSSLVKSRPFVLHRYPLFPAVSLRPVGGICWLHEVELHRGRIPVKTVGHGSDHEIHEKVHSPARTCWWGPDSCFRCESRVRLLRWRVPALIFFFTSLVCSEKVGVAYCPHQRVYHVLPFFATRRGVARAGKQRLEQGRILVVEPQLQILQRTRKQYKNQMTSNE